MRPTRADPTEYYVRRRPEKGGDLSFPNSAAPDAADQPGLPCRTDAKGAGFPNRLPDSGEGREKAHGTAVAHGLSAPAPRGGTLKW